MTIILGMVVLGCAFTIAAVRTPGFNITTATLSQLALTTEPNSQLVKAALVFLGATFFPFAFAVCLLQTRSKATGVAVGLLIVTGVAVILIGVAPHSNQHTFLGLSALLVHNAATRMGAVGALGVVFVESYAMQRWPRWRPFYRLSLAGFVAVAVAEVLLVLNWWPRLAGIFELLIIGPAAVWLALFAVKLHRIGQARG